MPKDPFILSAKDAVKFGSTPVENLFMTEFLPSAPAEYVKVYLSALFQSCYPEAAEPNLSQFASALGMDTKTVLAAMRYWEMLGIVRPVDGEKDRFELVNIRTAMFTSDTAITTRLMYRYAEFNAKLATVTRGRQLTPAEYGVIYNWIEEQGFSEDAILAVAEHAMKEGGRRSLVARMTPHIQALKNKGLFSGEEARAQLEQYELLTSPARAVVRQLGMLRLPTMDEHNYYIKWRDEWGFSPDAIIAACAELTRIREPNFMYLDRVLASKYAEGKTSVDAIGTDAAQDEADKTTLRPFARALGVKNVKRGFIEYLRRWRAAGMEDETLLLLCTAAADRGIHTFAEADAFIGRFIDRGVTEKDKVEADLALEADAREILFAAGLSRRGVTEKDKELVAKYSAALPLEVMLEGASLARDKASPLAYLNALLARWAGEGIKTVAEARKSAQSMFERTKQEAQQFENASFDEGTVDDLVDKL
ncbi:MAG: DnaD domain protein [Christensenellales bacterium]|jgi:DNA replication protein DnaD